MWSISVSGNVSVPVESKIYKESKTFGVTDSFFDFDVFGSDVEFRIVHACSGTFEEEKHMIGNIKIKWKTQDSDPLETFKKFIQIHTTGDYTGVRFDLDIDAKTSFCNF